MGVVRIEGGKVSQRWEDVKTLDRLAEKYGLSGEEYVVGKGRVGQLYDGATFSDPPPETVAPSAFDVKEEVRRRILLEASMFTQINLAAAAAAGKFVKGTPDFLAYLDCLNWVDQMRKTGAELVAAGDATFANDEHWPAPPSRARQLAARF